MEVQVAVVKVSKYATSSSGDTVEVVERPQGGVSVVLADGQSSGKGAKTVSSLVVRKVISLLAEGVRDGAAARAASDSLFTEKSGKVSATLNILSVDQLSRTLVITRNSPAPALLIHNEQVKLLNEPSIPIGLYRDTRPVISEVPLESGLTAIVFSDGMVHAGERIGQPMDITDFVRELVEDQPSSPQALADQLLEHAMRLDQHRPADDISLVVMSILPNKGDETRRMTVRLPLDS